MKRFIAPADIRAGDLIRFESTLNEYASEWRADGHPRGGGSGTYFLLDRPEPAVELPTEPTLGWATWRDASWRADAAETFLMVYRPDGPSTTSDVCHIHGVLDTEITAFTPATAVPTTALDYLRSAQERTGFFRSDASVAVRDFLTAVDEANRA